MKFSEAFGVYRELVLSSQTRREITSELGDGKNMFLPYLENINSTRSEICKFCN